MEKEKEPTARRMEAVREKQRREEEKRMRERREERKRMSVFLAIK